MKRKGIVVVVASTVLVATTPALAGWPGDPAKCRDDAVKAGSLCMDKYEASVWEVPDPLGVNKALVKKIQNGKVKLTDLMAGGAIQRGAGTDNYPVSCPNNGQGCADIYAVSISAVTPSAYITWFQAQQACGNSRKRLPTNGEWQLAVAGSPDPGGDNGSTDCNTLSTVSVANAGSRSGCVSSWGAYDMVGNVEEWVADWVPRSTTCGIWSGSNDSQCLAGAATTGDPGTLLRGGHFYSGSSAGPLAVHGGSSPSSSPVSTGFRCAR